MPSADAVTEFAPAKINLALHVLGRRADGYHDLDSVVAFADVGDRLSLEPAAAFAIETAGPFAGDLPPSTDNIVHRAWSALRGLAAGRGRDIGPVAVRLEKNLPVASGMGGGSANAAAALRGLVRLHGLDIAEEEGLALALKLGADVPVCYKGVAVRMQGVGERLTPLAGLASMPAVLVNPRVAVPTADIFRAMGIARGESYRDAIADLNDICGWRNDMTDAAVALAPAIADVLDSLRIMPGLTVARMSGSGATCFGIFETAAAAQAASEQLARERPGWWVAPTRLS